MIRFACPGCSAAFTVDDAKGGKTGNCPKCQTQFVIPMPEPGTAILPDQPPAPVGTAEPVEIEPCPKCQTRLSVAAADVGSDVECPHCQTVFRATKAGGRPPAPPRAGDPGSSPDAGRRPRRRDDEDDDRPRRRGRRDEDDEDRPKAVTRSRESDPDDDYEDRPRRRTRRAGGTVIVRRVGVLSCARMMFIIYLIIGLIVAVPYTLLSLIGAGAAGNKGGGGVIAGMGLCVGVLMPIIYGAMGFIGGAIFALLYNLAASKIGGIEMELGDE